MLTMKIKILHKMKHDFNDFNFNARIFMWILGQIIQKKNKAFKWI